MQQIDCRLPAFRGVPAAQLSCSSPNSRRAVELLQKAFAEGQTQDYFGMYGPGMAWFRQDPHFESLRDFPPYLALLRPKG